MDMRLLYKIPIKMCENRVAYLIKGGGMIDEFYGRRYQKGSMKSQAWIASTVVSALSRDNEGLSRIDPEYGGYFLKDLLESYPEEFLGKSHVKKWGSNLGFLLKLLHSEDRLLVQTHPDKTKARKYFNSAYGKTEAWHILETKEETACIYAGFREGVTPRLFRHLIEKQDTEEILNCLHCFNVKKGDTIIIKAGLPHALGADCLAAEIQEPTDITLRSERIRPDGSVLPENSLHSGIGMEGLIDCFNFECRSKEQTYNEIFVKPEILKKINGSVVEYSLISPAHTDCFSMNLIRLEGEAEYIMKNAGFKVILVIEGEGNMLFESSNTRIRKGDEWFIPYGVKTYGYKSGSRMSILECYPPQ